MTEQDVRDGLLTAVAGEPPLSFDPDALIATAHRQLKRRRALVSVGVATALIAVAAVAVPVAINGGGQENQVADRPHTYQSWPPKDAKPPYYTKEQLSQLATQMERHLDSKLRALLPNATEISVEPFGGEASGQFDDGQNYLNTFAAFTIDKTRYGIGINIFAPGADIQGPNEICATTYCSVLDDVNGGQVVTKSEDFGTGGEVSWVYHFRASGTQVSAGAYNYDPTGRTGTHYTPTVPITDAQLLKLATDPALNL